MKKMKVKKVTALILTCILLVTGFMERKYVVSAATADARIVDYDSGSTTERFHYGRSIGATVNINVIGDKESITVTNVKVTTSDSSVCSVKKVNDHYQLSFLKEGIAVITMTCKANSVSVEKRLLASCLTPISSSSGILKANSVAYRGCSDKEGISSRDTEIHEIVKSNKNITIDGECGNYYRVWLEEGDFGKPGENGAYVKKQDVIVPLIDISIPKEMSMYEDTEQNMDIKYIPGTATSHEVTWKSSNINVVKVDSKGKLTAGKSGSAVITVTSKSNAKISKKCRVTVKPYIAVTGIKIIPDKTEVDNGQMGKIKVEIIPSNASVQDFTWHISNDEIIMVDPKGRYVGKKPGEVEITVTTKEGNFTDSCKIKVLPVSVKGISLQKEAEIDINEIYRLVWNTVPTNATNKNVVWKSDNTSVVKVDEFGNVIGVSLGSANIIARTEEGNHTAKCKVTVCKFVNDINMTETYYKLKVGKKQKINIKITPLDCTKKEIVWRTSKNAVVSVSQNGTIKTKKPGDAKITVYDQFTGAYDFALIDVTAGLKKPNLKVSSKNKKYTLSWKKQKYATKYIVYEKVKGKKKFKKIESLDKEKTKYVLSNIKKQNQYKIRCYCKDSGEYSKYSNIVEVK